MTEAARANPEPHTIVKYTLHTQKKKKKKKKKKEKDTRNRKKGERAGQCCFDRMRIHAVVQGAQLGWFQVLEEWDRQQPCRGCLKQCACMHGELMRGACICPVDRSEVFHRCVGACGRCVRRGFGQQACHCWIRPSPACDAMFKPHAIGVSRPRDVPNIPGV
jgi:hypothetical protein